MKSKVFKYLVLASALTFMNCGDDAADALTNAVGNVNNPEIVQPGTAPGGQLPTDPNSPAVTDPNDPLAALSSSGMADPSLVGSEEVVDPTFASSSSTGMVGGAGPGGDVVNPVDPWADPCVASSLPDACGPGTNPAVNPTSGTTIDPASSADVAPVSSAVAEQPASSSSEVVVSSSSEEAKPAGIFLAEGTDENKDQMRVKYIERTGDNGGAILAYPEQLSSDKKHGVVLWGPGGGTEPGAYGGIIRRLASHGFVVIATSESPDGTDRGIPALNWLENKNKDPNDPLYQKLDMTKVGASGHSMGGLQSEKMLIKDNRVITAVLNNSGAFNHAELTNVPQGKTAAIVYGEGGMERPNAEGDYFNNNVRVPACLLKMTGGQGNECYNGECGWGHGSGPWGGMAATVAWMRWHLGGEDFRKADFVGTSGKYINGAIIGERGNWKGQCKNF